MSDTGASPADPFEDMSSGPTAGKSHPIRSPYSFPAWFPPLFFLLLPLVFLWRSLLGGEVFLPASLLAHVAPWHSTMVTSQPSPWNPLRWDGIGQFYPWRKFAAETLRSGTIPLWNPYQFCGTPFVANSQSAVFYPGNLLFLLIPDTAFAFGWSAALHLALCGCFMYLLMRRLNCSEVPSLLAGVVYAYSSWQTSWLQLPTFLATSCWFPLLLRQIYRADSLADLRGILRRSAQGSISTARPDCRETPASVLFQACQIGVVVGLMLLAGHLQIALYGLMAGTALAVGLLLSRRRPWTQLWVWAGGLALGLLIAAPQLLPAIELSRISHRVSRPSWTGYRSYTDYALPAAGIAATVLPDIFGGEADPANPYWAYYRLRVAGGQTIAVYHNPAETAIYLGIVPMMLALFACLRGLGKSFDRRIVFFAALALAALLLAFGTPVDALLYFGVPGFAQSGSPARCLVLWALAGGALAALGLDSLLKRSGDRREVAIVLGCIAGITVLGLNLTARSLAAAPPGIRDLPVLGDVLARIGIDWCRLALFTACGAGLLWWARAQKLAVSFSPISGLQALAPAALALVIVDLFWAGIGANPTSRRELVYPETKGITFLQEHAAHDRILPLNQRWSLFALPPATLPAVLPPNAATVYRLRDVQGYDSLFSGAYKAYANRFARPNRMGALDASPIEVGNIVFFQNARTPGVSDTGAAYVITVPFEQAGFAQEAAPRTTPIDTEDPGMMVYDLPGHRGRARLTPETTSAAVAWLEDEPTRVSLDVDTPAAAEFSLMDANLAGWRLRIDGHPAPIFGDADVPIRRAAALDPGRHRLVFHYEPASFRVGLYAACGAALLIGLSLGLQRHLFDRSSTPDAAS